MHTITSKTKHMKIEFIKEQLPTGQIRYYTEVDGNYIHGSLSFNKDEAMVIYNMIVENKGVLICKVVLETAEV